MIQHYQNRTRNFVKVNLSIRNLLIKFHNFWTFIFVYKIHTSCIS
jgi:hypothetical protein